MSVFRPWAFPTMFFIPSIFPSDLALQLIHVAHPNLLWPCLHPSDPLHLHMPHCLDGLHISTFTSLHLPSVFLLLPSLTLLYKLQPPCLPATPATATCQPPRDRLGCASFPGGVCRSYLCLGGTRPPASSASHYANILISALVCHVKFLTCGLGNILAFLGGCNYDTRLKRITPKLISDV